jgi:REP element-mobilizing transposase RayT
MAGGTFFFTVNLANRSSDTLMRYADEFRSVVHKAKQAHPFSIVAMVVLPDHLHTIWRLPEGDNDYPMRWSLIKAGFSRRIPAGEKIAPRQTGKARTRYLATALLGTPDPRRIGFGTSCRLHPLQSGQAWLGVAGYRLAALDVAWVYRTGNSSCGLGWRGRGG